MAAKGGGAAARTATAALDRQDAAERSRLAQAAIRKIAAGERPTVRERSALRQWEADQRDRYGSQLLEEFPKKRLCDAVGVSQKVMGEKSRRFGLGYHTSGKTCRPLEILGQLLAWTSEHKHGIERLLAAESIAEELGENNLGFWQVEYLKEKTDALRFERKRRERETMPRELVRGLLDAWATRVESRMTQLEKRNAAISPAEVLSMLRDDLDAYQRDWETALGDEGRDEEPS